MSEIADLLALLYRAHGSYRTVHGKLIETHDSEVQARLFEAMAEREDDDGGTSYVHFAFDVSDDEEPEPASGHVTEIEFWVERPDRIREEHRSDHAYGRDGFVGVQDGKQWWFYDPRIGGRANEPHTDAGIGHSFASLLDPVDLLGGYELDLGGEVEHRGRRGIAFTARPRSVPDRSFHPFREEVDELRCVADLERGIVLRRADIFEGDELKVAEVVEVSFDETFPPGTFELELPEGEEFGSDDDFRHNQVSLDEAAERASLPVFAILRLPEGNWRVLAHHVAARERPVMQETVSISYMRDDAQEHIQLHQTAADAKPDPWPVGAESESVERDGVTYTVVRGESRPFAQPSFVVWQREGTRIAISSNELEPETLLELAASLERV